MVGAPFWKLLQLHRIDKYADDGIKVRVSDRDEINRKDNSNRAVLDITDAERRDIALKGIVGKRLTYRRTAPRQASA